MTFRGSTPGSDRIDAIRCEMTWVLPEPAQAMICSGSFRQAIASAWAAVYDVTGPCCQEASGNARTCRTCPGILCPGWLSPHPWMRRDLGHFEGGLCLGSAIFFASFAPRTLN